MISEVQLYECSKCGHAAFDTKAKLSKHISSRHRETPTFELNGVQYSLIVGKNSGFVCPKCGNEISTFSGLKRHMKRSCKVIESVDLHPARVPEVGLAVIGSTTTETDTAGCMSLDGMGLIYDSIWNIIVCTRCQHVVDQSMITDHLTKVHKVNIEDEKALWATMQSYKLRPHLVVIWDELTEQAMDDSDDEYAQRSKDYAVDAFRPGSSAVNGIPVSDGFKCLICERALTHKCVQSKEALRTHYKRNHANTDMDFCPVRVQAFYGRSLAQNQLRYVQVQETPAGTVPTSYTNDYERFGIPGNVHSVPTSHTVSADRRDLNLFGKYFFAYKLLESLDLAELVPYLHNPSENSFAVLKRICKQILEDSRVGTSPGFQVVLTKLMEDDDKREFFREVQEQQTVENYSLIWCKVLWVACLAVSKQSTLTVDLSLTPQQTNSAEELVEALDEVRDCHVERDDELYVNALKKGVELSSHILRHEYGITNKVDPDTGASRASSYIVPRAINLLALRPNGTFLNYPQITHIAAAIRYVLRSIMLYNLMAEDDNDDEAAVDSDIAQFLSRRRSSAFAYCVQLHASCSSYGSHSQLPTITWATDDFTALRLTSGALLTLDSLRGFLRELYDGAEALLPELCLNLEVPTLYARNLHDYYSNSEPGYSFLSETANALPTDYLWTALQRDRSLRGQYIIGDKIMSGSAKIYLQSSTKLLETLFLLMHLTYGSPARMSEIDSWKHVNSIHGVRNVYCHHRGLVFLGLYNKTTSLTGTKRFIVHLVPARLEMLFLKYLIYIRPVERLFTAAVYRGNGSNDILEGYQQYLFAGHRGRFGAERLRRVVIQKTHSSKALHSGLNVHDLRQALVAFMDHHVGHAEADKIQNEDMAHDIQSGHSSKSATVHYAIGTQDLPKTNRYDVHFFMKVSETWFKVLGESLPLDGQKEAGQVASPSGVGQSIEQSVAATTISSQGQTLTTTIIKETTEIYTEISTARLLPVSTDTFRLLRALRGADSAFRSREQAGAIQTIISNPGDSHLVVLPTGGGKSDIVFLSSMYERTRGRITLLVLPFVALKYDLVERAKSLGLTVVQWSSVITKESITTADILVLSIENLDSRRFRQQLTEFLISKQGNSIIARIFFDEAHTILSQWDFRPSFQAISDLTGLSIPIVLLSATVPPTKVDQIRRVYNRHDLRLIRAPTTMRANITYNVERIPSQRLRDTLKDNVVHFLTDAQQDDRALVFCMSVSATEELYDFSNDAEGVYFYHGKLSEDAKLEVLNKWLDGEYKLLFCTSGFGVGIDYGSVSLVIHYDGMWNLLDFVQESGRAGRNHKPAHSLVLLRSGWTPNFNRMPASEAQAMVEYLNPDGLCRRFVLGKYMDGFGYSCLTFGENAQLCDHCRVTKQQMNIEQSSANERHPSSTNRNILTQHSEGPMPAIKRVKKDLTVVMRDAIETVFTQVIHGYGGCVFCALDQQNMSHERRDALTILMDHHMNPGLFGVLDEQVSVAVEGRCYGCGLNLRLLNRIEAHTTGSNCLYRVLVRLICYDIFLGGKIIHYMTDLDPGSLRTDDMGSFGKWLRVHSIGESANNLTRVIYNWIRLRHLDRLPQASGHQPLSHETPVTRASINVPAQDDTATSDRRHFIYVQPERRKVHLLEASHNRSTGPQGVDTTQVTGTPKIANRPVLGSSRRMNQPAESSRSALSQNTYDHVIPRRLDVLTPTVQVGREKNKSTDGVMGNSRGNDAAAVEILWPAETLRGGRKRESSNTLPTDFGQTESRRHHHDSRGGLGLNSVEIDWPVELLPKEAIALST